MKRYALSLVLLVLTLPAAARVISYAPYTDRTTLAAFQHRATRHFLVVELTNPAYSSASLWEVVLYDSTGGDEPRVVYSSARRVYWAAMWEDERHTPAILIAYNESSSGNVPAVNFSNDGGRNFIRTALPATTYYGITANYVDNGGPFTRGRLTPVRIGNRDFPFVVYDASGAVWRVASSGIATRWHDAAKNSNNALLGSDVAGTRFLVRMSSSQYARVGFDGSRVEGFLPAGSVHSGWITPDDRIYFETSSLGYGNGAYDVVQSAHYVFHYPSPSAAPEAHFISNGFAVPTHDYSGAWLLERSFGSAPTRLLRHTPAKSFELVWSDPTAPETEALHAGASGRTLLIQVHRPRPQPDRIITDPALAVWRVGDPPPSEYDELFLAEQGNKGFVHVDPDRVADGDPFVFDSGLIVPSPPQVIISPFTPGSGADILQEWGVVRASLKQELVLPGVGRALGAHGSNWATDVTLYNPAPVPQKVTLRFAPAGTAAADASADLSKDVLLNAKEIRVIPDILGTLYGLVGNGALFLSPERGINATARTYTRGSKGTYGFGMHAIDVYAAASPRFPVTFAGAFPGPAFRTNVTLTDVTAHGGEATLTANGSTGAAGMQDLAFGIPAGSLQQINGVAAQLGIPWHTGGLSIRPKRGFVVASVFAIDNATNDPTYFPPDINTAIPRWIPVIGHLDGAFGSQFRTDVYAYNPSPETRTLFLTAHPWNTFEPASSRAITMKPNESRILPDVYFTSFGKTGLARLSYSSSNPASSVRVTSRTYTIDATGGTYGCLTPPLNGFQMAARGESLEILGITGGAGFRTNLGIVEMNAFRANNQAPASARIEIIDASGRTIDDFTVSVPIAGGMQINGLFRVRGHGDGPPAALVRVSPLRGQITAYATVTDNTTNDSIYLSPYLAAQE